MHGISEFGANKEENALNFIKDEGIFDSPVEDNDDIHWATFDLKSFESNTAAVMGIEIPIVLSKSPLRRIAEYVAGRYCAKQALNGLGVEGVPDFGIERQPIWPNKIWGSISHIDGLAIAAASRHSSIGLDIENIVESQVLIDTLDLIITPSEKNRFNEILTRELFTVIFSFKESFYKAAYPFVKRFFDFSMVDVLEIDWPNGKLVYRINEDLCKSLSTGTQGSAYFLTPFPNKILTIVSLDKPSASPID